MLVATGEIAVPPDPTPDIPPGEAIAVTVEITQRRLVTVKSIFACRAAMSSMP